MRMVEGVPCACPGAYHAHGQGDTMRNHAHTTVSFGWHIGTVYGIMKAKMFRQGGLRAFGQFNFKGVNMCH